MYRDPYPHPTPPPHPFPPPPQVKSRQKALEKLLESKDLVQRPPADNRKFRFRFPPAPRSGVDEIVDIEDVTHGYNVS